MPMFFSFTDDIFIKSGTLISIDYTLKANCAMNCIYQERFCANRLSMSQKMWKGKCDYRGLNMASNSTNLEQIISTFTTVTTQLLSIYLYDKQQTIQIIIYYQADETLFAVC